MSLQAGLLPKQCLTVSACLLQQIEILNSEVIARATGNISQMKEICSTKQHLGGTTWENASLDLLAEHKTQHISELQLLHVSREIQVGSRISHIQYYHSFILSIQPDPSMDCIGECVTVGGEQGHCHDAICVLAKADADFGDGTSAIDTLACVRGQVQDCRQGKLG